MIPIIETLAIGDELLVGKISDTNSQFVAQELFNMGLKLARTTVVADALSEIEQAIRESSTRAKAVIVFGGLGPTSDDRTAEAVAGLLKCPLAENLAAKQKLVEFLKKRGRELSRASLKQVLYPETAQVIYNAEGLAPGFHFNYFGCEFYFLPGVPSEMKPMVMDFILPRIKNQFGTTQILSHCWRCIGIHESQLQEAMNGIEPKLNPQNYLGYRTDFPENHLTLYWGEDNPVGFEATCSEIRKILEPYTYSEENKSLETKVIEKLILAKKTIVTSESCTGGLVLQRLTRVPGASNAVWGSFVNYQFEAKKRMLGVEVPNSDVAVSAECSLRLAEAAKNKSGCDISAAVTGFMGPEGGVIDPVGTVYLCVTGQRVIERKIVLPIKDRFRAQWGASANLLRMILEALN